jgi:hypothetical protein
VVEGRVAGRWRLDRAGSGRTVRIEQFDPALAKLADGLAEEAEDLGRFLGEPVTLGAVA